MTWKGGEGVVIRASREDAPWDIEHSDIKDVAKETEQFNSRETEAPSGTVDRIFDELAEEDAEAFK